MDKTRFIRWLYTGPRLYVITDKELCGLNHPEIVRRALRGGAKFIQIRDKKTPDKEFKNVLIECVKLCHDAHAWCIVNDRVFPAMEANADGVHLGQSDMDPDTARKWLHHDKIIGRSTHNRSEFIRAMEEEPVDYVAFGSVFPTTTKGNAVPASLASLSELIPLAKKPIAAIGGITLESLDDLLKIPIQIIAVISDIMKYDIEVRVREYIRTLEQKSSIVQKDNGND